MHQQPTWNVYSRHALVLSCRLRGSRPNFAHDAEPRVSLHTLYHDIRLVQLAYPGADTVLAMHVGKEALITALDNANLQLEVMKHEPATVEIALGHAIKLEAYEHSLTAHAVSSDHKSG